MTQPQPQPEPISFAGDDLLVAIRRQRDTAIEEAAQWEAAYRSQRRLNEELTARVSDFQEALAASVQAAPDSDQPIVVSTEGPVLDTLFGEQEP